MLCILHAIIKKISLRKTNRFSFSFCQMNVVVVQVNGDGLGASDSVISARDRFNKDAERTGLFISTEIFSHYIGTISLKKSVCFSKFLQNNLILLKLMKSYRLIKYLEIESSSVESVEVRITDRRALRIASFLGAWPGSTIACAFVACVRTDYVTTLMNFSIMNAWTLLGFDALLQNFVCDKWRKMSFKYNFKFFGAEILKASERKNFVCFFLKI